MGSLLMTYSSCATTRFSTGRGDQITGSSPLPGKAAAVEKSGYLVVILIARYKMPSDDDDDDDVDTKTGMNLYMCAETRGTTDLASTNAKAIVVKLELLQAVAALALQQIHQTHNTIGSKCVVAQVKLHKVAVGFHYCCS